MRLLDLEAQLRAYLARVVGVPIVSVPTELPVGSAVAGVLSLQSREAGRAVGGMRAVYTLDVLCSDAMPAERRRALYEMLASQVLVTESASQRDEMPTLDYQIALEELSDERLRFTIEVEWNGNATEA